MGVLSTVLACVLANYATDLHSFTVPLSTLAVMIQVLVTKKNLVNTGTLTSAIFSYTYISYFMSFWIRLLDTKVIQFSNLPMESWGPFSVSHGSVLLWWTYAIIASADIGGYMFGKFFGSHPVSSLGIAAGTASPGKTIEGVVGGMVFAVASAVMGVVALNPIVPWHSTSFVSLGYKFALAYGVILALLSFISDVSVSLFKRNAGVKDASDVLPGHGGVLDRMDSYILTAPVVYMFWTLVSKQIETL